jgi:hypothetical protein
MKSNRYAGVANIDAPDPRLAQLHDNVHSDGTTFNTVAPGIGMSGALRRKASA